jgi:SAM-dependent methyltransferase
MHETAMAFACSVLSQEVVVGKIILEVGSYNVNGSVRPIIVAHKPARYIGVDFSAQDGFVDFVLPAEKLVQRFGEGVFDIVVSTEMLEHAEHWKIVIDQMKRVLRFGGLMVVTCRGPGVPWHGFPDDFWRFTTEDFIKIFADFDVEKLLPDPMPGVLFSGRRSNRPQVDLTDISVGLAPPRPNDA